MNVIYCGEMFVVMFGGELMKKYKFRSRTKKNAKLIMGLWIITLILYATKRIRNSRNTVSFIEHLRTQKPDAKQFLLIWDGASYHKSHEIQEYLQERNWKLTKENWTIRCILFAPNAPEQNPVEDIWLKGKNFLRKHFFENKTFAQVKQCFFNFLEGQVFDFPKLSL
jgi:transposase